jgi:ATP-dependent exoDNAse (exonuclease V) beta subunit
MMTVHKAKGLEFPVVILCGPTSPAAPNRPSRLVDPERRVWAMPLAGCAPAELLANRQELLQRDREEVVRVAYVAATRARDVLVVPAQGIDELQGWLEPLSPAIYPRPLERRQPRPAPGCPPFGKESVLDRPEMLVGPLSVSPGLHTPTAGSHEVVWWGVDDREPEGSGGLLNNDLLVESGNSQASSAAYEEWRAARERARAEGAKPSLRVETATALSVALAEQPATREVQVARVAGRESGRPVGKRFGALVHASLAACDLSAQPVEIERVVALQARLMDAAPDVEAASRAVRAALEHPVLRAAAASLEVRREEPLLHAMADGTMLEGVVDLAFRDAHGWTVVDFKTDRDPAAHPQYAAQLRLYCDAIEAATKTPSRAILLAV